MSQAAFYARVSTRRQEQEATIESQVEQLLAYAQQNGYQVSASHQYIDQAISGQRLARPALDRLRDQALAGAFTVLLCLSPDRLARNLGAQQVILDELKQVGVQVIFITQPNLPTDPQSQLLINIQGAFAEYERVLISERMRRGRLYKLRHGQSVPSKTPYGYRYQPAEARRRNGWIVLEDQAIVVKQMFVWYTADHLTLAQIVQQLNASAVPAPAGLNWNTSTVGRILRQPAYKGTAFFNRHQADYSTVGQLRRQGRGHLCFPRLVPRSNEEWIEVQVPPLVDEMVWQAAQERLAMNAQFAQRNSQRNYLLRGLLVCSVCGYTLQGRTRDTRSSYHCAHGGKHRPADVPQHSCTLDAQVAEPLIWQALSDLLRNPQQIEDAWQALCSQQTAPPTEVMFWRQRQQTLSQQRQRLLNAYQAGVLSIEELTQRQNPLMSELRDLEQRLARNPSTPTLTISMETFAQRIEQALATANPVTRQEVLRLLIERIVVSDEALTVEYIIPTVKHGRLYPACRET